MIRLAALMMLWCASASAQVTIHNYVLGSNTTVIPNHNQVYKTDTNGDKLELTGQLNSFVQIGTFPSQVFYGYGNALGCGVQFAAPASAPPNPVDCGVMVYKSTDFVTWHKLGLLYALGSLGSICPPSNVMCFTATMIGPRASDGHFIFWMQGSSGAGGGAGFIVLDCGTTPGGAAEGGSCTRLADPTGNSNAGNTGQPFMDDDGIHGWLAYQTVGGTLVTAPLTGNLTNFDTTSTVLIAASGQGESVSMFRGPANTYYAVWGTNCAFCNTGSQARFAASSNPSVGWGSFSEFDNSNSSCQTQLGMVFRMTLAGGAQTWILNAAQWTNTKNQALAANYQVPLTFGTNTINLFNCLDTFTIAGLTPETPPPTNPALDQTSTNGFFYADQQNYIIDATHSQMETMTPSQSFLSSITVWVSQVNSTCPALTVAPCGPVNGDLGLAFVDIDQTTLNPTTTLASTTVLNANVSWNSIGINFPINLSVTPGHHYGIVASCVGTCNNGATYVMTRDLANPYSGGVARQQTSGTWATLDGGTTDFKFSTFGPTPSPGSGGHGLFRRAETYLPSIQ